MKSIKEKIRKIIRYFGVDVARHKPRDAPPEPPPLFDHPQEALCYEHLEEKRAAFQCPLDQTVNWAGFDWAPDGWHPFVVALLEYSAGKSACYENSILKTVYRSYQPGNATEAIAGFDRGPKTFHEYPPHVYRLSPWRRYHGRVEEFGSMISNAVAEENREHGESELNLALHGDKHYGPVSDRKGRLEYNRLINVYESIQTDGYRRTSNHGRDGIDVCVDVLQRGNDFRFLCRGGHHRMAAMTALGYDTVPAVFKQPLIINTDMSKCWPQVRRKVWTQEESIRYFDHLFDFDSRTWAKQRGLLVEKPHATAQTAA